MKKVFMVMVALQCLSCASAPTPPPENQVEQPAVPPVQPTEPEPVAAPPAAEPAVTVPAGPDQALIDELNAAKARAETARTQAADFESHAYFPSDWENAEARHAEAGQLPLNTSDDARQAAAAYNAAADAYDALFKLTIPLYAQAREDSIMAARSELIAAGVRDSFPDYFRLADTTALQALDQYEAADYYAAKDTAEQTALMFQSLMSGYRAWLIRREINTREFAGYDADNYDTAEEKLHSAAAAYEAGDIPAAHAGAGEALLTYELVLSAGWAAYTELRASLAGAERQAALDIKANVAARDLFTEADSNYKTAAELLAAAQKDGELTDEFQNYEKASAHFVNAEAMFVIASTEASEKRQRASELIKQANTKIEESDETALQAEHIMEGGTE